MNSHRQTALHFHFRSGQTTPHDYQEGMTMRDYFAAKAMQGLISGETNLSIGIPGRIDLIVEYAFAVADAMIEKRLK